MATTARRVLPCAVLIAGTFAIAVVGWLITRSAPPPLQVPLADGRILQIEAVTFGTIHKVGRKSVVLQRFGPWLPAVVRDYLKPKWPHAEIHRDRPGLVVWVNALDAATGTNVDCQGVRIEFVDKHGDLFGTETSHWFGGNTFWHQGHVFDAYPRGEDKLRLRITPWATNVAAGIDIPNPMIHRPAPWVGRPLPQTNLVAGTDIILRDLVMRTNGGPKKSWQTPARFWEPVFELRRGATLVGGWDAPEWTAEDPTGNHGQFLGVHQRVLKYSATFYPSATNVEASRLIASLPAVTAPALSTNVVWNLRFPPEHTNLLAYGVFPPGRTIFGNALVVTNMPGPTPPGTRGWSSQSRWINPLKVEETFSHYTQLPTLYLQLPKAGNDTRFGVRFRDEQNRYWLAAPDGRSRDYIYAYLIDLPPDAKTIVAEVVELNPIKTEFMALTPIVRSP